MANSIQAFFFAIQGDTGRISEPMTPLAADALRDLIESECVATSDETHGTHTAYQVKGEITLIVHADGSLCGIIGVATTEVTPSVRGSVNLSA